MHWHWNYWNSELAFFDCWKLGCATPCYSAQSVQEKMQSCNEVKNSLSQKIKNLKRRRAQDGYGVKQNLQIVLNDLSQFIVFVKKLQSGLSEGRGLYDSMMLVPDLQAGEEIWKRVIKALSFEAWGQCQRLSIISSNFDARFSDFSTHYITLPCHELMHLGITWSVVSCRHVSLLNPSLESWVWSLRSSLSLTYSWGRKITNHQSSIIPN